jgi:hypothetical protein
MEQFSAKGFDPATFFGVHQAWEKTFCLPEKQIIVLRNWASLNTDMD